MTNIEKLKQLGVYDQFCKNTLEQSEYSSIEQFDNKYKSTCPANYISYAFYWGSTPEGMGFWGEVSEGRIPPIIILDNLTKEVAKMRVLQKQYFATRSEAILVECKVQEGKVDAIIQEFHKSSLHISIVPQEA